MQATNSHRGKIMLIEGCMFAGKTGRLLSELRRIPEDKRVAFKHVIDDRYSTDAVVSHDGDQLPAVRIASATELAERVDDGIEFVALEEAHFFPLELATIVKCLADRGIGSALTGLDHDTWGQRIPVMAKLASLADEHIVLKAKCAACGAPAERSHRLTPIIEGNLVGGAESFEPRCLQCWSPPSEPAPTYS